MPVHPREGGMEMSAHRGGSDYNHIRRRDILMMYLHTREGDICSPNSKHIRRRYIGDVPLHLRVVSAHRRYM